MSAIKFLFFVALAIACVFAEERTKKDVLLGSAPIAYSGYSGYYPGYSGYYPGYAAPAVRAAYSGYAGYPYAYGGLYGSPYVF